MSKLPRHYEQVGIKAVRGVLANIDATGELQQVSFGTAMGDSLQFYKDIRLTSQFGLNEFLLGRVLRSNLHALGVSADLVAV